MRALALIPTALIALSLCTSCQSRRSGGGGGGSDDDDSTGDNNGPDVNHAVPDQDLPDGDIADATGELGGGTGSGNVTEGDDPWTVYGSSSEGVPLYVVNRSSTALADAYVTACGGSEWVDVLSGDAVPQDEFLKVYLQPGCWDVVVYGLDSSWFWAVADIEISGAWSIVLVDPVTSGDDDDSVDPPDGEMLYISARNQWGSNLQITVFDTFESVVLNCLEVGPGGSCAGNVAPGCFFLTAGTPDATCYWYLAELCGGAGMVLELDLDEGNVNCP